MSQRLGSSALGLLGHNYQVAVVADATGSPGTAHGIGLERAAGAGALITTTQWVHWKSLAQGDFKTHVDKYGQGCKKGDPRLCSYDITVTNREADTANRLRKREPLHGCVYDTVRRASTERPR